LQDGRIAGLQDLQNSKSCNQFCHCAILPFCNSRSQLVTLRRQLIDLLSDAPRSASSIARDMGLRRGDVEDELLHALRSAEAAGHRVEVIPARCKDCGFVFDEDRLTKPGRCPSCKGSRLFEPQIRILPS
jgi:hypothetical protein